MLTVVTYFWPGKQYRSSCVQQLQASVTRWLDVPHRFVCVADEPIAGVETMPNPAPQFPRRCYRRLWLFSAEAARLGSRILHLDLDLVICGPLAPLVSRPDDFTIYRAGSIASRGYSLNPSVFCLTSGTQTDIWDKFNANPGRLAEQANKDGFWGSDQAVISHLRRDVPVATYDDSDGIVSFRRIRSEQLTEPPAGTRIVSFHGRRTPFEADVQAAHPWIRSAWATEVAA